MTTELTVLALAGVLQAIQFAAFSIAANMQIGPKVAMGPRDNAPSLTGTAGRLQRALNNHFEGLILFTLAVVVVTMGGQASGVTATCAWIYLIARLFYVPAYVLGWTPGRSIIWMVGFTATLAMILAALF
ncbi:MAPEG family protein [Paracoccus fistulariae]|uniref:MAPEG family protein n=1 Tax=Paracoccus fistulariae TaxID=658446 RepID=A0ABY7SQE5_9RHOB|nr:MAPEG family protein [Paracoccus fistulariae]MDB6180143.1 MAPEG family protein [Paracoccus fistulariae]WCR08227.1 MAPEG family protein [Paracoccus fistulariae]